MSPKKNRSYAAGRARAKQAAGATAPYTELLSSGRPDPVVEALPVWVGVAVLAPCASPEERQASAQVIADALAHLTGPGGHRYPAAAAVVVAAVPWQARGGFLQLSIAVEALRDWSDPGAAAATMEDVRQAIAAAATAAWPASPAGPTVVGEISRGRWDVITVSEVESYVATRGVDPALLSEIGTDSGRWGAGDRVPGRVVWERPKGRWVPQEWSSTGTPFTPPAGTRPADNPYGEGHGAFAVPFLLTVTLPRRQFDDWGTRMVATAVQAGCRFLVRDNRWYRAHADVFGPLPAELTMPRATDTPTPEGWTTVTLLVSVFARRPADESPAELMHDAFAAIAARLADQVPAPAGFEPAWVPVTSAEMAGGLRDRLTINAVVRHDVHPSLLPDRAGGYDTFYGGFPHRVVDAHCQGWHHTGQGRYNADFGYDRGLARLAFDELAAGRGPLDFVVPPEVYEAEQVREILGGVGRLAAGTLLVAVHRVAARQAEEAREQGAPGATLYAGREGSWETAAMRTLAWDLGADLADNPARFAAAAVDELVEVLEGWTEVQGRYTEVAGNLAHLFGQVADAAGGWSAVADEPLQPGATVGHSDAAVEQLRNWLLSTANCRP
ncbi:hypothetical protein [Kitasatospora sp. NPDC059327]|uniref:hypothetical protein n=1 Tax=Kitasatospora sp. NPDC059327 TaxID=3346803 RepID=UPI0036776576